MDLLNTIYCMNGTTFYFLVIFFRFFFNNLEILDNDDLTFFVSLTYKARFLQLNHNNCPSMNSTIFAVSKMSIFVIGNLNVYSYFKNLSRCTANKRDTKHSFIVSR